MSEDVLRAARRVYVGSTADVWADDAVVRAWALRRWLCAIPKAPAELALWVLSDAAQNTVREQRRAVK